MTGRWNGKLTSRPLPEVDETIDALTEAERARLAETWLLRAAMERRVGDSFAVVRDALRRRNAPEELVALAERAIDDESRHEELSRVVASRFAGEELELPKRLPLEVPAHKGASPELRDTLHIIGQCVFNETTASAYLECSLDHATDGTLAKSALRTHRLGPPRVGRRTHSGGGSALAPRDGVHELEGVEGRDAP
jgi:hypothetical protein